MKFYGIKKVIIIQFIESKEKNHKLVNDNKENRNKEFNKICKLIQAKKKNSTQKYWEKNKKETLEVKGPINQIKNSAETIMNRMTQMTDRSSVLDG